VRMDFPSYPVDIVLPSFNRADTAHDKFLAAVNRTSEGRNFGYSFACKPFFVAARMTNLMQGRGCILQRRFRIPLSAAE
jgi:hypothetical protein